MAAHTLTSSASAVGRITPAAITPVRMCAVGSDKNLKMRLRLRHRRGSLQPEPYGEGIAVAVTVSRTASGSATANVLQVWLGLVAGPSGGSKA